MDEIAIIIGYKHSEQLPLQEQSRLHKGLVARQEQQNYEREKPSQVVSQLRQK